MLFKRRTDNGLGVQDLIKSKQKAQAMNLGGRLAMWDVISGDRLHQATAGSGIVVVVFGVALPDGINTKGGSTNKAAEEPEGPGRRDRIDELAQGLILQLKSV